MASEKEVASIPVTHDAETLGAGDASVGDIAITVTTLQGTVIELCSQSSETVAQLKARIEASGGPQVKEQRLLHETADLPDSGTLAEAGFSGSVFLTLVKVRRRFAGLAKGRHLGPVGSVGGLFANRSFTVEAWVRVHAFNSTNQGDNAILGCQRYETNKALVCQFRNGRPFMGFYYNDVCAPSEVQLNTWIHLAFAYNLEKREQLIFQDGKLTASKSPSEPLGGNFEVFIGAWAGGRHMNGEVALLNIWNHALSCEMVQESMSAGAREMGVVDGLVHSFTFESDEEGDSRLDSVTNQRLRLPQGSVLEVEDPAF